MLPEDDLTKFSLTRFLIAFTVVACLIGYYSRFGTIAAVSAFISSVGVFLVVLNLRSEHVAFLITVMPSMVFGYAVGYMFVGMSDPYPYPLESIIYVPLAVALLGTFPGFYLLKLVTDANRECAKDVAEKIEGTDELDRDPSILETPDAYSELAKTGNGNMTIK